MALLNFLRRPRNSSYSNTLFTNGTLTANWINLAKSEDYLEAFYTVPPLNAIITNLADAYSMMKWVHIKDEKIIENSEPVRLLNKPNIMEAGNEFQRQLYVYYKVFGNSYVYGLRPVGIDSGIPKSLWNLPSQYMKIYGTGKYLMQTEIEDIIDKYELCYDGLKIEWRGQDVRNIMHKAEVNLDVRNGEYLVGKSRLESLKWPLSNIKVAYEAQNVLIAKKGAIGVFSTDVKSNDSGMPLMPKQQQELQDKFNKYGPSHDKWQYIFTEASIKWNPISFPIKDMMLNETIKTNTIAVSDAYGYKFELLGNENGVTYSNRKEAEKALYQDTIIPDAMDIAKEFHRYFNLEENEQIIPDYSHIPILQEDQETKQKTNSLKAESITDIASKVFTGQLSKDSGLNILIEVYGFKEEQAKKIIGEQVNGQE